MKYVNSLMTVTMIGGLSLLLVTSGCSSGTKPKTASKPPSNMPRSEVVTDRGTTPGTAYQSIDRTKLSDRSPEIAAACPSRMDAQGMVVFDDPTCPDRYRRQAGNVAERDAAGLATACPSRVDATTGKVVYDDPTCPDRYRHQIGDRAALVAACPSRVDANGKIIYDDPACPARNRYLAKENAFYDRYADKAVKYAWAAEIAANQGNVPDLLDNAESSLDHAKEARRAGNNADLAAGIAALRQTISYGQGNEVLGASSSIRDARISLSRAAGIKTWDTPPVAGVATPARHTRTFKGELSRGTDMKGVDGKESYVLRDPQNREVPIRLSPEMSRQVQVGDMVEAQIEPDGQVTSITKAQ